MKKPLFKPLTLPAHPPTLGVLVAASRAALLRATRGVALHARGALILLHGAVHLPPRLLLVGGMRALPKRARVPKRRRKRRVNVDDVGIGIGIPPAVIDNDGLDGLR